MYSDIYRLKRTYLQLRFVYSYDNGFAALVSAHVKETVEACLDDPGVFLMSHLLMMKSLTSAPS